MDIHGTSDSIPVVDRPPNADGEKPPRQTSVLDAISTASIERHETGYEESKHVHGVKLAIILVSLTMVFFLVMLDLSIIATVSQTLVCWFYVFGSY